MRLRSLLFVPADRPDRIDKAYASGAAGVAVDLEDAVAASAKAEARQLAVAALRAHPQRRCAAAARINAADTGLDEADLEALTPACPALDAVIVPKVSSAAHVERVAEKVAQLEQAAGAACGQVVLLPTIESAAGVLAAPSIAAAHERVATLIFGPADLSTELNVEPTPEGSELLHARSQVVLATAAAGRPAPVDGPHLTLDDPEGLARSAMFARRLGFGGKTAIHPRQLEAIATAFAPSAAELAWARQVECAFAQAEAQGMSSIRLSDGSFVDYPVARRARALLAAAQDQGGR